MREAEGRGQKRSWGSMVKLPVFLIANAALLLVVGASTVRETYRGWTVDREIQALEDQAVNLEGRKSALETLTKDIVSKDRIEYDARSRLGRKQPGERVIVLEGFATTGTWDDTPIVTAVDEAAQPVATNPERWVHYFFH